MPLSHLSHFAFLVPGNYHDDDPGQGLEETLQLFEAGEALGLAPGSASAIWSGVFPLRRLSSLRLRNEPDGSG